MLKEVSGFPAWGAGFVFDLHGRPRPHVPFQKAKKQRNTSQIRTKLHPARLQYHRITVDQQAHVRVRVHVGVRTGMCVYTMYIVFPFLLFFSPFFFKWQAKTLKTD